MQSDSETTTLDGVTFEMRYLDPQTSAELLTELAKIIAPPIAKLIEAQQPQQGTEPQPAPDAGLGAASTLFFQSLEPTMLRTLANTLAEVTLVDDAPLSRVLPQVFRGRIDLYFKWLWWGCKVQWGKCFGALAGAVENLPAMAAVSQRFASPSTSQGGVG
jgi:hypothetical protein